MGHGETVSTLQEFVEGWGEKRCERTHDWNNQVRSKEAGGGGHLEGRLLSTMLCTPPLSFDFCTQKTIFSLSQMEKQGRETGWGNC